MSKPIAEAADILDELLPLDSTDPKRGTVRTETTLSREAVITHFPEYVIQLTPRRKAMARRHVNIIKQGMAAERGK